MNFTEDPEITDLLLDRLRKLSTVNDEPFIFFNVKDTPFRIKMLTLETAGQALACLKFLTDFSLVAGIYCRPFHQSSFYSFCVFKDGEKKEENIPEFARDDPTAYTWFPGRWTMVPDTTVQHLLVVHKTIKNLWERDLDFKDITAAQVHETVLRLDLKRYNPFAGLVGCYTPLIVPGLNLPENLKYLKGPYATLSREINMILRKRIKDRTSLVEHVFSDVNRNFIDVNDSFNINSSELLTWMELLAMDPSEKEKDAGILVLNRVFGFCKFSSKAMYAVKTNDEEMGIHINYWSKDALANFMLKFKYYEADKEDVEDDIGLREPARKKRRLSRSKSTKKRFWFDIWLESSLRGEIDGVQFKPWSLNHPVIENVVQDRKTYYNFRKINEFRGWPVTKEQCHECYSSSHGKECVKVFKHLIRTIFCGGNTTYSDFVMKWIAWIVQKPDQKSKVAIIIRSQMGMGKSFVGKIFQKWFGDHYYILPGTSPSQKFNSFMHRKKVVHIDEVKSIVADMNIMNSLITEETYAIEKKGVDQSNESNLVEFFGGTNDQINLRLGTDTRRWVIIEAPKMTTDRLFEWKTTMSHNYDRFFSDKEHGDKGSWALLYWFLQLDITGFVPFLDAPKTEAIKKCIENSLHSVHAWWKHVLETRQIQENIDAGSPLENMTWSWNDLWVHLRRNTTWDTIYGFKGKLSENDFKEQMSIISEITTVEGGTKFKFRAWRIQQEKWSQVYPDVALLHKFSDPDDFDPFSKVFIDKINKTQMLCGLSEYTDKEKDYIITKMYERMKESEPNLEIVFNDSVFSVRRKQATKGHDVIEFI